MLVLYDEDKDDLSMWYYGKDRKLYLTWWNCVGNFWYTPIISGYNGLEDPFDAIKRDNHRSFVIDEYVS